MSNFAEFKHKGILINCTNSYEGGKRDSLYQAVRFAWLLKKELLDKEQAKQQPFVFAMVDGKICDVFKVDKWLSATPENFPEFADEFEKQDLSGRIGFVGKLADYDVRLTYIGKEAPEKYRNRQPCQYVPKASDEEVAE